MEYGTKKEMLFFWSTSIFLTILISDVMYVLCCDGISVTCVQPFGCATVLLMCFLKKVITIQDYCQRSVLQHP